MRNILAGTALLVLASTPLLALNHENDHKSGDVRHGARIGVLSHSDVRHNGRRAPRTERVARYLVDELRHSGYDAHLVRVAGRIDELRDEEIPSGDDYLVDILFDDGDHTNWGGVGVGAGAVDAEVSIVSARLDLTIQVYDASSLELVREFPTSATSVTPAVTGVGVGGWRGFVFVNLPILADAPYRIASRAAARDAAHKIAQ